MNIVFTIVARNYLSFAFTLADSLREQNSGADFTIFLVDGKEGVPQHFFEKYSIELVDKEIVPAITDMSFKYNVTEYSTAVKPFVFSHLFNKKQYAKAIYVDPDIYFYQSPQVIFDWLDEKFCVLTPHIIRPQVSFTGNMNDTELLFAGIYNLGFAALKNNEDATLLLNWWMDRLSKFCYGDRFESLHVDQKWMDFVPSYFGDRMLSTHHPGLNIAYWNIHERDIFIEGEKKKVGLSGNRENQYPIIFIHFSGVNPLDVYRNKQCKTLDITKYKEWESLIVDYGNKVINNSFKELIVLKYGFAGFDNGDAILPLHRRLYRRMDELNLVNKAASPFSVGTGSLHSKLLKDKLIISSNDSGAMTKGADNAVNRRRLSLILTMLRMTKRLLGLQKYLVLTRFLQKILSNENQLFLIQEHKEDLMKYYAEKYFNN
ncbi:MAG: hypothetical protein JNM14_14955 [Ferruginibacter sp.]|nr:hypothetical protein [Ferruginibacter sp.]